MVARDRNVAMAAKQAALRAFGARLQTARSAKELTQETVANGLGVSSQTVRNWEAGRTEPSRYYKERLAALYSKSVEWFYEDEVDRYDPEPKGSPQENLEPDPDSTYEEDMAFIESIPSLAFRGVEGDLTPEQARTVRTLIEVMRAQKQQDQET